MPNLWYFNISLNLKFYKITYSDDRFIYFNLSPPRLMSKALATHVDGARLWIMRVCLFTFRMCLSKTFSIARSYVYFSNRHAQRIHNISSTPIPPPPPLSYADIIHLTLIIIVFLILSFANSLQVNAIKQKFKTQQGSHAYLSPATMCVPCLLLPLKHHRCFASYCFSFKNSFTEICETLNINTFRELRWIYVAYKIFKFIFRAIFAISSLQLQTLGLMSSLRMRGVCRWYMLRNFFSWQHIWVS